MKSYSAKDFEISWFSGTGAGGQYRNKHQNCCRITHIETGLRAQSTKHRDRISNQRDAFTRLAQMLIALDDKPIERRNSKEIVRTYHFEDDYVLDHATRVKGKPDRVMNGQIDEFVFNNGRDGERPSSGRA